MASSPEEEADSEVGTSVVLDEDGDLILPRRQKTVSEVVCIGSLGLGLPFLML